jgi:hypothetical protein
MTEVFHTERIMWLAAPNPMVIFTMLTANGDSGEDVLGWLPTALQAAADGTQVPCINSQSRAEGSAHLPLELIGLAVQGGLAGGLLAGGNRRANRRAAAGVMSPAE